VAEAASVVFLFALAQLLETRAMDRARGAIRALMELAPAEARSSGATAASSAWRSTRPDRRLVIVGPARRSRSTPGCRGREPGQPGAGHGRVAAGRQGAGRRGVRRDHQRPRRARRPVTRLRRDSTLARIIHLVERAQAQRAPSQLFVERFARIYTPIVLVRAVLVALLPPLVTGPVGDWFYRALVLLVISCPCALVISTPVSIVSALAAAARKGVLIKGGAHLERLAARPRVAFDKTGTLTEGALTCVRAAVGRRRVDRGRARMAASLEARSEHPIGRAIVARAAAGLSRAAGADVPRAAGPGGRRRRGSASPVVAGNHRLFEERGLLIAGGGPARRRAGGRGLHGRVVAASGSVLGVIGVADQPRRGGARGDRSAPRPGHPAVAMLTGDHDAPPPGAREALGVDESAPSCCPPTRWRRCTSCAPRTRRGGDGRGRRERRAGPGRRRRRHRDGRGRHRRRARNRGRRADGRRAAEGALRPAPQPGDRAQHPREHRLLARLKAPSSLLAVAGYATLWMAVGADMGASLVVIANALRLLRE
jgi:Zn2+/Cd2+-exporting ATPase